MEAGSIDLRALLIAAAGVVAVEVATSILLSSDPFHPLLILAAARSLEALLILLVVQVRGGGFVALGLKRSMILPGLRRGLIWSVAIGAVAALTWFCLVLAGQHPLRLIRAHLPPGGNDLVLLFVVGGLLGPVAEELFFRGVLYRFFRRWGAPAAVLLSSLAFVLCHPTSQGIRLTQAVGGILFAVAYEVERSLLVPITIHILGNLAIFSLSLLS